MMLFKAGAVDYILKDSEEFNNLPKMADNALAAWDSSDKGPNSSRLQYNMPTILDTMPDGVVVVDVNGEIVYANAGPV
jgi:PAS domain-containing protein